MSLEKRDTNSGSLFRAAVKHTEFYAHHISSDKFALGHPWPSQQDPPSQQDTFNTAGGDAVVILPVWLQSSENPLPLKLQGGKVVGHTVPDAQGNPGTSAGAWASSGVREDPAELPQAPRHARIGFPSLPQQTPANSATVQVKWFPTFRCGKSGCWAALVPPGGSGQEFFLSACHPRLHLTHHPASTQGSEPPPPFI